MRFAGAPCAAQLIGPVRDLVCCAGLLCHREDFIFTKMKTYIGGWLTIEIESTNDILNVRAEFLPGFTLGEDVFSQCFCDVAAVRLLVFQDEFAHKKYFNDGGLWR